MVRADLQDRHVGILGEAATRVGAEETECLLFAKLIPQVFQLHGRAVMTLVPKYGDHFSEGPHPAPISTGAVDQLGDELFEAIVIEQAFSHEMGKGPRGIDGDVAILRKRLIDIIASRAQPPLQSPTMLCCGDDDDTLACPQPTAGKTFECVNEYAPVCIDLNGMFDSCNLSPEYFGRGKRRVDVRLEHTVLQLFC